MFLPATSRRAAKRGFLLIGMILALVIIFILVGYQLGPDKSGVSQAKRTLDRGKGTACMMNRNTIRTNLASWRIMHANEKPTMAKLDKSGMSTRCPEGGDYSFSPDLKNIFCSKHAPNPRPTPTPRPTPSPRPTPTPDLAAAPF